MHALARVSKYMSFLQRRIIMDAFISSHFNYCSLVWMCHSRKLNNQINRIHHRALRIVYRDYTSSFESLLEKSNSVTIHMKNIQTWRLKYIRLKTSYPLFLCLISLSKKKQHTTFEMKIALFLTYLVQASMV